MGHLGWCLFVCLFLTSKNLQLDFVSWCQATIFGEFISFMMIVVFLQVWSSSLSFHAFSLLSKVCLPCFPFIYLLTIWPSVTKVSWAGHKHHGKLLTCCWICPLLPALLIPGNTGNILPESLPPFALAYALPHVDQNWIYFGVV